MAEPKAEKETTVSGEQQITPVTGDVVEQVRLLVAERDYYKSMMDSMTSGEPAEERYAQLAKQVEELKAVLKDERERVLGIFRTYTNTNYSQAERLRFANTEIQRLTAALTE